HRLLDRITAPHLREEIQGDLDELFYKRAQRYGYAKARRLYIGDVIRLLHPRLWRKEPTPSVKPRYSRFNDVSKSLIVDLIMLRNYLKLAFRNLAKHRGYSTINIGGLAVGIAVAMLVGLWVWDEVSYNKSFRHYDRIALVKQHMTYNGQIGTQSNLPYLTGSVLRAAYGNYFTHVVTATGNEAHVLSVGDKTFSKVGSYMEPQAPELLSLTMRHGTRAGLVEPGSILLSETVAHVYFGDTNPVGKLVTIDNNVAVKVTGVYQDLPRNSEFSDLSFILPWKLYLQSVPALEAMADPWGWNGWYTYVQLADNANLDNVSASIQNLIMRQSSPAARQFKPFVFLDAMRNWHLYSEFKNGVRTGGLIEYVWLFGVIGVFVLLLACINFMNLSTARSEKRAKEVGIRKSVGS
ncbi:MAG: ABC transporter permease, partial [Cytophagaceae bacterium]